MRTKKMILVGFKRFALPNIQRFVYTPESRDQVILGSNGSGKSSFLRMLLDLCPSGNEFYAGGSYEHTLEHQGHEFQLISVYKTKAGHHQFFMDGVDINDGNTQATQKELIARHIGLTPEIRDLMTGKIKLSKMKANERRDWLMRISGTDFEYALSLFNHFREKSRDLKGTIAYLLENTHKMAKEIESLDEDYKTKDDEVAELRKISEEVDKILNGRIAVNHAESSIKRMTEAYTRVKQRSDTIVSETRRRSQKMHDLTKADLELKLLGIRDRMMQTRGECDVHEKALEGIQSLIRHVGRDTLDDPSKLVTDIQAAEEELSYLNTQGAFYECHDESPEGLLAVAQGIQGQLSELCVTIPVNSAGIYTRGTNQERTEKHKRLSQFIIETNNVISKLEAQLEHANHAQGVDCPKCNMHFKPGWPPELIADTQRTLERMHDGVAKARVELEELDVHIGDFQDYSQKLGELSAIRAGSTALRTFWELVNNEGWVRNSPVRISEALSRAISALSNMVRAQRISKTLEDLKSRLELIKNSGDPKFLLQRADLLEGQLHDASKLLGNLVQDVGEVSEEIYHLEKLDKLVEEMNQAVADFEMYREIASVAMQEECLDNIRDQAMARLGVLHLQTQRYRDLTARYENNREEIIDAESRFSSYKLITKALSPTDGIIAEVIKGFIGHFLHMVNGHIDMVWTYPMEISAVLEDGATLNCKLPIIVNGEPNDKGDVDDGSTGQVSMIDFSFKLVVMELLGMTDYPLLADEFGKDFDDEHRERLVTYIKDLMEEGRFSQLFMVSHYSSVYGAFNGAEFVVLDERNITRPGDSNQNVEIS